MKAETLSINHLDHLNMSVADLETSIRWYRRVFDFDVVERGMRYHQPWAIIRSGEAMLCLYQKPGYRRLDDQELESSGVLSLNHFAFRIADDHAWEKRVERERLELAYGGVNEHPHSRAWYVTDPNGYEIEVAFWRCGHICFDAQETL